MAARADKIRYYQALHERLVRQGRSDLLRFTMATMPTFEPADFHRRYYKVLTDFANGDIKKLMVFMPPQHGKALPIDTPILTTKGWVNHGELKSGDYVFGDDGKPKMVLQNWGSYEWNVMRITFADGRHIDCAPEHLWKVYCEYDDHKGRREMILETQDIFKKRHRRSPYIKADVSLEMPDAELPINPYILGLWLGDGLSRQGVIIAGAEDAGHYTSLGRVRHIGKGQHRVLVDGLSKNLRECGLICNKHIPMQYMLASEQQRWELLRGLMDTDGYVDKRGRCEFSQMEGQLADDVYVLMRSLGLKPTKHSYKAKLNGKCVGSKVRMTFSPERNQIIFKLPRKQQRLNNKVASDRCDKKKFFIKSIAPVGRTIVNCIQVEGGMYLAGHELYPTHNSEGSTRRLPAFLLGQNPDKRLAIVSYNAPKARKFNREIQRIIDTPEYHEIFPDTNLNASNDTTVAGSWLRNADECEIVGYRGGFKTVGVGGALTGEPVDILIMDDIYKDAKTAWSPIVRESVSDWYDTVAETRLHNDSQQLIVFTRWHEDDQAGKLLREQGVYDPIENPDGWVVVIYKAIKEGAPTKYDPRQEGEALWEERHNLHKLLAIRKRNPQVFDSLYQQDPKPRAGLMYESGFKEYAIRPATKYVKRRCYVDTADTGADYLCAIVYDETEIGNYLVDVLYTTRPVEYTEPALAKMLTKWEVADCIVEANNGGRLFKNNVERQCRLMGNYTTKFKAFHQTENKENRIYSHSAMVQNMTFMPQGWQTMFPEFSKAICGYLKAGKNEHDDAADALTGTIEKRPERKKTDVAGLFGY